MPLLRHILEQRAAERAAETRKVTSGFEHAGQVALAQVIDQSIAKHLGPVRKFLADSQNNANQLSAKNVNLLSKVITTAESSIKKDVEDSFGALIAQVSRLEERLLAVIKSIPVPEMPKPSKPVDLSPLAKQLAAVMEAVKAIPLGYEIDFPEMPAPVVTPRLKGFDPVRDRDGYLVYVKAEYE